MYLSYSIVMVLLLFYLGIHSMSGDPPTAFLHGVLGQVNRDDLVGMVEAQRAMYARYSDSFIKRTEWIH